jgi:trehalose 6-phosphate phosphatase
MQNDLQDTIAKEKPGTLVPAFGRGWAFFLDVDGTLLDFAERPDAVHVDRALGDLLANLQTSCGRALALISGRTVNEIDRLFAPLRLPAAGQHGIERRDAVGVVHRHTFSQKLLQQTARTLRALVADHPGLLLEEKECSLALHYRLAPQLGELARHAALNALRELGPRFEVLAGKFVYELKPGGRDKGIAIEEFTAEVPFAGRIPVFVGDDATDEYGFAIVNRLGGHSIKVGPGASIARWRLADAAAVRQWLDAYIVYAGARVDTR